MTLETFPKIIIFYKKFLTYFELNILICPQNSFLAVEGEIIEAHKQYDI